MGGQDILALYTIGYEQTDISSFIAKLRAAGIDILVDVRAIPRSRKQDFSKSRFSSHLQTHGIDYLHEAALGNPKAGRDAARAGDLSSYETIFRGQLANAEARRAIERITEIARLRKTCLLCLERDPQSCHRSIVAKKIVEQTSQRIVDLFVD